MSEIEALIKEYERQVNLPWDSAIAGDEKIWFVIYDPAQERRLRLRIQDFESATIRAHHTWELVDITDSFATWMAQHEYREAYFEQPDDMELALKDFADSLAEQVRSELDKPKADGNCVVALLGVASLFGLGRASDLIAAVAPRVKGRLLVFFPGRRDGSVYRLLDARDGWDYLAVAIEVPHDK